MDVEHVVADHLLPHPAGPLSHLQGELVQVGANGRAPEAAFAQQLVLDGRPLLCHVFEGVLLSLRVQSEVRVGNSATLNSNMLQVRCMDSEHLKKHGSSYLLMLLVLHGHQVSHHGNVCEHPLESLLEGGRNTGKFKPQLVEG